MAKRKRTSGARKKARRPEAPDVAAVPDPQATDRERAAAREPDQDVVDDLGDALGVPQAPDAEFRPSAEILEARDRQRWEHEP